MAMGGARPAVDVAAASVEATAVGQRSRRQTAGEQERPQDRSHQVTQQVQEAAECESTPSTHARSRAPSTLLRLFAFSAQCRVPTVTQTWRVDGTSEADGRDPLEGST